MGTAALVSVEQYLKTVYEPEVDYVDGELEDRNVGEKDHSKLQARFVGHFLNLESQGIHVFPEVRIRVAPTRFRVPDVCVYLGAEPEGQVLADPPFLVIEILSPEDRMSRMLRKIQDYQAMGVPHVWVADPWDRKAYMYDGLALVEARGSLTTADPRISVPLDAIFPRP
jgi:Uma2 family endonuclease